LLNVNRDEEPGVSASETTLLDGDDLFGPVHRLVHLSHHPLLEVHVYDHPFNRVLASHATRFVIAFLSLRCETSTHFIPNGRESDAQNLNGAKSVTAQQTIRNNPPKRTAAKLTDAQT
jgi:hypothetical protein